MKRINNALNELRKGKPILVYDSDGREEETDIVIAAEHATPEYVKMLRKDGGGLVCVSIHPKISDILGLPYLTDIWTEASTLFPVFNDLWPHDIPYDEKSAFSITINHRNTFTGISDLDRSLTITELEKIGQKALTHQLNPGEFGSEFRSPGHVTLLRAADGLLRSRKGHTELSVTLMDMAGLTPMAAICEMLGDDFKSLGIEDAKCYALDHELAFIEGRETIEWYLKNREQTLAKPRF
jgi:3,4-dihydroxy 2-butanone 4-phosphate synthase